MFNQPLLPCRGSALQAVARGRAVPGGEALYEYSVVAKCLALRAFLYKQFENKQTLPISGLVNCRIGLFSILVVSASLRD